MSQATVKALARDPKKARYALINIARGQLCLDEETYRALLYSITGKSSLRKMSPRELDQVIDRMKADGFQHKPKSKTPPRRAGTRALADDPHSRKARALWLAGYHLGVIRDPREEALVAFARRQTSKDALQWAVSEDANDVIEALKDMMRREADVVWEIHERRMIVGRRWGELAYDDRYWILRAQWRILRDRDALAGLPNPDTCPPAVMLRWTDADWYGVMECLGQAVRIAVARSG
ncbi:MAG: regulatory protein GemA [Thalassobaculaceae bacterium]